MQNKNQRQEMAREQNRGKYVVPSAEEPRQSAFDQRPERANFEDFESNQQMRREQPRGKYVNRDHTRQQSAFDMQPERRNMDLEDELRPTAPTMQGNQSFGNQGGRNVIDIDERNETVANASDLDNILARGRRLKERMDEAMGPDAWSQLHGTHEVPKQTYLNPFHPAAQDLSPERPVRDDDRRDHIYSMEIEANLGKGGTPAKQKPQSQEEMKQAVQDIKSQQTVGGGRGGNIADMRFVRLKVKCLRVNNNEVLQDLIRNSFSLTVALPLPDIYQGTIQDQFLKLSNYDVVSMDEFEYNSLSLYNFKVSEATLAALTASSLQIILDDKGIKGTLQMGKLLLAGNFQMKCTIPLYKIKSNFSVRDQKKQVAKKQNAGKDDSVSQISNQDAGNKPIGEIDIELNLQQGDTEEELMRNYQLKLQHQEEIRQKTTEVEALERRRAVVMQMEKQPTFAQLYMRIDQLTHGGISFDRDGKRVEIPASMLSMPTKPNQNQDQQEPSQQEQQTIPSSEEAQLSSLLPKRSLFVSYKSFPTHEKLMTSVQFGQTQPAFNYRAQFPVLMSPTMIDQLEQFTFVLEVWDQVSPIRNDLVGLVKVPLQSFCYNLKTTHDDIYSLNFLADQHNMYPMTIVDESVPIFNLSRGENVGFLRLNLSMGTPVQVNRQIEREKDLETTQKAQLLAEERQNLQNDLMRDMAKSQAAGNQAGLDVKMTSLIQTADVKRKAEEEDAMNSHPLFGLFGGIKHTDNINTTPGKKSNQMEKFAQALRMSLNAAGAGNADYDVRQNSFLNCMRKLFEEVRRSPDVQDVTGEGLFTRDYRNLHGQVHKDDFIYLILDKDVFTLTRTEASNIVELMMNIVPGVDEKGALDIDEIQASFQAYLKYYELIEKRVIDLMEKIKLAIVKKLETNDELDELIEQIQDRCVDSKLLKSDLQVLLEDQRGIVLRESIYDQLGAFFDLDRSGQIYMSSLLSYINDPTIREFNFFKVNPHVIAAQITEYVRNSIASNRQDEQLAALEKAFAQELFWKSKKEAEEEEERLAKAKGRRRQQPSKAPKQPEDPPVDILLNERINAKIFQEKLKKQGINLCLWEIFTLFEYLNTVVAKQVFYEPQRYHACLWEHFQQLITGQANYRQIIDDRKKPPKKGKKDKKSKKRKNKGDDADALSLAESLNKSDDSEEASSDEFSSQDSSSEDEDAGKEVDLSKKRKKDERKPYHQVKHTFDINLLSLHQIPILSKYVTQSNDFEQASQQLPQRSTYIQQVALKYSFPLDEDEQFESDYIKRNPRADQDHTIYDFDVSMNTVHSYRLGKSDTIQNHLSKGQMYNIALVVYQDQKEFILGNAQMPIEDLLDLVKDYDQQCTSYQKRSDTAVLKRIIFLYGTSYSQRENCIIGKVELSIKYQAQRLVLSQKEYVSAKYKQMDSCFLHRETYINRKIPLNAVVSVWVDRVTQLKESIENIEHFAKIHSEVLNQSSTVKVDRRRILTQILKNGLNLQIITSLFEEDIYLKEKFKDGSQESRMLFNSLCPVFDEGFQMPLQMDTKIFEYLKNRRAIFEVRHYLQPASNYSQNQDQEDDAYLTLGWVRVPLLHLITKNNGIDGEFTILDDYKQKMGCLRLKIALNHHNNVRPLFQQTTNKQTPAVTTAATQENNTKTTMIEKSLKQSRTLDRQEQASQGKYLLVLNFIEMIMRERSDLLNLQKSSTTSLYLKFTFLGKVYQTKFLPMQSSNQLMHKLNMMTFEINKATFIELDLSQQDSVESAFARPLEVELWHKVKSEVKYAQPDREQLIGTFMIELNELPKQQNKRIKGHRQEKVICSEGYYTMYDFQSEKVSKERLALKIYLLENTHDTLVEEMDLVMNSLSQTTELAQINHGLKHKLDPSQRGYVDLEDLQTLITDIVQDPKTSLKLTTLVAENLEYKNADCVFYSPLLSLPPPYFRFANDIDQADTILKFYRELAAMDSHQQGFVPTALMKSAMCDRLKVKQKIVADFIQEMTPNRMDVNRTTNDLQNSQLDYILLVRKLLQSLPPIPEEAEPEAFTETMKLNIRIESAMRLRNPLNQMEPPSAFIRVNCPFEQTVCNIETDVVPQSCYPYWMQKAQKIEIPLTPSNQRMIGVQQLEFQVYHQQAQLNGSLIGTAYVDISSLQSVGSAQASNMISGYYHVVDPNVIRNSMQLTSVDSVALGHLTQGQIKVTITTDKSLTEMGSTRGGAPRDMFGSTKNEHTFGARDSVDFGVTRQSNEGRDDQEEAEIVQTRSPIGQQSRRIPQTSVLESTLKPQTQQYIAQTIHRIEGTISQDETALKTAHLQNMSDLDQMLLKMKQTLSSHDERENSELRTASDTADVTTRVGEPMASYKKKQESTQPVSQVDFGQTHQFDDDRATLNQELRNVRQSQEMEHHQQQQQQMQQKKAKDVFNPFESKINEHSDEQLESAAGDHSFDRDRD